MCRAGGRDLAGILGPVLPKLHASRRCVLPINSGLVVPFVSTTGVAVQSRLRLRATAETGIPSPRPILP